MNAVFRLVVIAGGLALSACVSNPKNAEDLTYAKKAIDVGIACAHDCNFYGGQPHTVYLTFYELAQHNMYTSMLDSKEGIAQLVVGGEFDKTFLSHQSVVVQPGEYRQVLLDRVEGSRYLAVIAGYRNANPRTTSLVYPIQLYKTVTFFWRSLDKSPKMRINMRLGREGFLRLGSPTQ